MTQKKFQKTRSEKKLLYIGNENNIEERSIAGLNSNIEYDVLI